MKKVLKANVMACRNDMTNAEWLKIRQKGIGGSDAGAIMGLNPFSSAFQVYCDKLDLLPEKEDSEAMRIGRDLEEYVAKRFNESTGKKVKVCNYILNNPDYPFMMANVDRLVVGENAGLECKTTSAFNKTTFTKNDIPPSHYAQCVHYMAVTGADRWYIGELVLGVAFFVFSIERNEEEIQKIIEIEKDFWENNVLKQVEPIPDGSDRAGEVLKYLYNSGDDEKQVDLTPFNENLRELISIKGKIKEYESKQSKIEQEVQAYMKDATIGFSSAYKTTWQNQSQKRIDTAKLKAEMPNIYDSYSKNISFRKFIIKEI